AFAGPDPRTAPAAVAAPASTITTTATTAVATAATAVAAAALAAAVTAAEAATPAATARTAAIAAAAEATAAATAVRRAPLLAFDLGNETAARQVHTALRVDLQHLHLELIADVDHVRDALDRAGSELTGADQAFLAGEDLDESAEIHQPGHPALVGLAD